MAFDGIMLRSICAELNEKLAGSKVDKITQPERDEINIRFRAFDKANKCNVNRTLLLSSNPSQARIHLTQTKKENPPVAPNFCMLLRKRLTGAKFIGASQPGLERVLHLDFECSTELYQTVTNRLTIEIMGRCSNIVFTDENGKIRCGSSGGFFVFGKKADTSGIDIHTSAVTGQRRPAVGRHQKHA